MAQNRGCCPDDYTFVADYSNPAYPLGYCELDSNIKITMAASPCVGCNCSPPIPITCPTCGTEAVHIYYQFAFNEKNCDSCVVKGFTIPHKGLAQFLPTTFYDPDITFKLLNKNFL